MKLIDYHNLPDTCMVKITDSFRMSLFANFTAKQLAATFSNSVSSFKYYKRGESFIPINLFKKLLNLNKFDELEINASILEIKKRLCGKSIKLMLPIFASADLAELIGHTLGDGHISKAGRFVYVNTSTELIDRVIFLTKTSLDRAGYYDYRKRKDGSIGLYYPSAIGELLVICGGIKGKKVEQDFDIPEWIKQGDNEIKGAFIRALFDDEGTVSSTRIAINMAKLDYLAESLRKFFSSLIVLLNDLDVRPGRIVRCARRRNKNGTVSIGLLFVICGFKELTSFYNNIGFIHSSKQEKLRNKINSFIQPNYHNGETRAIILNSISGLMSTKEISRLIQRGTKNARYHLKLLEKEGKLKKVIVHQSKWLWQRNEELKEQAISPI